MHDKRKCMAVSGKGARNLRCAFTGSVTIGGLWLCKVHAQLYEEMLHTDGPDAARRRIMLGISVKSERSMIRVHSKHPTGLARRKARAAYYRIKTKLRWRNR